MSLHINFRLSDSDLEFFASVMQQTREKAKDISQQQILANAEKLLEQVSQSDTADFIRDHMSQIETLIGMIVDEGWGLIEEDRERVLTALSYFSESQDLIPDDTPALGYLDDAIIIDIVCKALEQRNLLFRGENGNLLHGIQVALQAPRAEYGQVIHPGYRSCRRCHRLRTGVCLGTCQAHQREELYR